MINLIAEIGNGKSSLINTILTALRDFHHAVYMSAPTGKAHHSYTRNNKCYNVWNTNPIRLIDIWGWQLLTGLKGLENLVAGQLRENSEESKADENQQLGSSSKGNKPHAYITLCDINIVNDQDKMEQFRKLYDKFKQTHGTPTLVALTKLDRVYFDENEEDGLAKNLHKIHDCSLVNNILDLFTKGTGIPQSNVFLIVNYEGENDPRNSVKDYLALRLLDKVITSIEDNCRKNFKYVQIADQTNKVKGTIQIQSTDVTLSQFQMDYLRKLRNEEFNPTHFYKADGETPLLDEKENYDKVVLEDLLSQEESEVSENEEIYDIYQLKVHNTVAGTNVPRIEQNTSNPNTHIFVKVHQPLDPLYQKVLKVRVTGKETLKNIREKVELPNMFVFSKESIGKEGHFKKAEEGNILVRQVTDSKSTLYVISEFPIKMVKINYFVRFRFIGNSVM